MFLDPVKMSSPNYLGPTLGSANVPQEMVDNAIKTLVNTLEEPYQTLLNKVSENRDPYDRREWKGPIKIGPANYNDLYIFDSLSGGKRYYAQKDYKINALDPENPLHVLLISLSKKIASFDHLCNSITLRFEKGCIHSSSWENWHYDGGKRTQY